MYLCSLWRTGKIDSSKTIDLLECDMMTSSSFPADEQIDLSNLRRRFLATNQLEPLDEERPVRGRELNWRRVSRAYHYRGSKQ